MTDLWLCTTDMLKSIANQVTIKTNDHLRYLIYANDEKNTKIGIVAKTYASVNSHVKIIYVKLRNNFCMKITADTAKSTILTSLSEIASKILEENAIIKIENM